MSAHAMRYAELEQVLEALRASPPFDESVEDLVLAEMDFIWPRLSGAERDEARQRAQRALAGWDMRPVRVPAQGDGTGPIQRHGQLKFAQAASFTCLFMTIGVNAPIGLRQIGASSTLSASGSAAFNQNVETPKSEGRRRG